MREKMDCPKDLSEWINKNPKAMWFVYDLGLMPEQIHTREEVCALRGFQYGWRANEQSRLTPRARERLVRSAKKALSKILSFIRFDGSSKPSSRR